jgi:ribosomal protein L2
MVSKQSFGRCAKTSLSNKTMKRGIQISCANIQRRLWAIHIIRLLILRQWNNKRRTQDTEASGFCRNSYVSTWRHRARMRVLSFIGRHHSRRVVAGTLHSLLYATSSSSATVVAPVHKKIKTINISCASRKLTKSLMIITMKRVEIKFGANLMDQLIIEGCLIYIYIYTYLG